MRIRSLVVAAACIWAAAALHVVRAQQPPPQAPPPQAPPAGSAPAGSTPRSVLEGVFTDDQAKRGLAIYVDACAHCHGNSLEGGEEAPPLAGGAFLANWNGSTVGALVERTRRSMPDDYPGSMARQEYVDVIAYLLSANRYPAGKTELDQEIEKLKLIRIEMIK